MNHNSTKSKPKNGINLTTEDPVKWEMAFKKINFNTYQFRARAILEQPWRLYAQETALEDPTKSITSIEFDKDTLLHPLGNLREVGVVLMDNDKKKQMKTYYYNDTVDYVQYFKVFKMPECIKGLIHYTPFTEKDGLSTKVKSFQIKLSF